MKKLFSYLFLSLLVMGVASCSDDALVSNESGEKNVTQTLSVTGTIVDDATTRVSLADGGTSITPSWEVGDQVFGFYGSDSKLTYQVERVSDGVATFSLVNGTEPTDGTTVHMIYAPGKNASDLADGQLAVDLSQQDGTLAGVKNHAIMCATATVSGTSLELSFQNQVAIVGVKQFTGLKASTTYTSATFTSAGPTATVKVDGGVLKLVTDDAYGTITANGSFASNASGNTTSTIYFAVPPTAAVAHTFCLHSATDHRAGHLSPKAVTAGKYLYMNSKEMVQTLFYDDFESTALNAFPSSLQLRVSGSGQNFVCSNAKNGEKGLHLQGRSGYVSKASQKGSEFNFSNAKSVTLECYMNCTQTGGAFNGCFGLIDLGANKRVGRIVLYDGYFHVGENNYITDTRFATNKWYHVKIQGKINPATQYITTYQIWVDGKPIIANLNGTNYTEIPEISYKGKLLNLVAGNSGTNTVIFDDVIVYTNYQARTTTGTAPVTITDNVNANARTSCGWVQLWAGGPKWAEFNVGSGITSYANVTSYSFNVIGGYYSFKGAKHNVENVDGVTDTATSLWGSNWRTPSYDEENAMLNNCDFTYCDGTTVQYESGCTLKGYKVSGKGDYASNHIFLPLGGVDDQNRGPSSVVAVGERGLFWSTQPGGSGAYFLHVTSDGTKEVTSHNQPHGNSVRAVLKEQ